ncbi:hypothetical protein J8I87_32390 [Paraburkholderia sp. LEh10]|uniref:CsgG/HfaB family protein n=1 Tax=Paraburkholderia sp. LEh10 TaxID=2821353 RepID=UPI001AE838DA|nr:CsgG/HfaB family protein [Paraburkholderia sp. LEh10]MBP0594285.1 hypothetical protein [Paraburkholderia sp. LEh10]
MLAACATVSTPPQVTEAPVPRALQQAAQVANSVVDEKAVKRKVAIGRFSNETRYGRTFVTDANLDPLGKQASDILASRLAASKQFLVFERPDIAVAAEQSLSRDAGLIGVDALILGSVTEFGRKADGSTVYISGGALQGIKPGANLHVYKAGESIQSGQTLRRPSRFNRSAEGTNTPDLICCTSESDDWSGFAVSLSLSRGRVDGRNLACSSHSNGRVTVAANVNFATV